MSLEFVRFGNTDYPQHEAIGGASLWIRPLAQHYCKGNGLDIGYYKEEWMLPGAIGIEPSIDSKWHAMCLPDNTKPYIVTTPLNTYSGTKSCGWDYIHSSHCLEHVKENVYNVLDYWLSKLRIGGIMFLYLPHPNQEYWHPENNRKHVHTLEPQILKGYLAKKGHNVWVSGCDWNHSFVLICEKS